MNLFHSHALSTVCDILLKIHIIMLSTWFTFYLKTPNSWNKKKCFENTIIFYYSVDVIQKSILYFTALVLRRLKLKLHTLVAPREMVIKRHIALQNSNLIWEFSWLINFLNLLVKAKTYSHQTSTPTKLLKTWMSPGLCVYRAMSGIYDNCHSFRSQSERLITTKCHRYCQRS